MSAEAEVISDRVAALSIAEGQGTGTGLPDGQGGFRAGGGSEEGDAASREDAEGGRPDEGPRAHGGRSGLEGGSSEDADSSRQQIRSCGDKLGPKDFDFGSTLGEGSYSRVIQATNKQTGNICAIKIVEKALVIKEKKTKHVVMEKDCLNMCRHPGIVRLLATFQDSQRLYFVMEACPRDLFDLLREMKSFSEESSKFFAAELVDILEYIHSKKVIHRDLKPENMLVSHSRHIKLTDFGTARIIKEGEGRTKTFVGTAEYCSPELLENVGACQSSDLWALGCTVFQFISGKVPFRGATEYLTFQQILALEYRFPEKFPPNAKALVESFLVLDPAQRLGADSEGNAACYDKIRAHPFFEGIRWKDPPVHMQEPPATRPYADAA